MPPATPIPNRYLAPNATEKHRKAFNDFVAAEKGAIEFWNLNLNQWALGTDLEKAGTQPVPNNSKKTKYREYKTKLTNMKTHHDRYYAGIPYPPFQATPSAGSSNIGSDPLTAFSCQSLRTDLRSNAYNCPMFNL